MESLIILPNDSMGLRYDAKIINNMINEITKNKTEIVNKKNIRKNLNKYKNKIYKIKFFIEHLDPSTIQHVQSEYNIYVPNVELLEEWDVKYIKYMDYVLCKNKFTHDFFKNIKKIYNKDKFIYTKFTSIPNIIPDIKKDYNLFGHFAGTSPYKNTLDLIKLWIKNGGIYAQLCLVVFSSCVTDCWSN